VHDHYVDLLHNSLCDFTNFINLQDEYNKTDIQKILEILYEKLIGLKSVKNCICEILVLLLVDKLRQEVELSAISLGTGKITVALKMADILYKLGYIRKGHLLTVTRYYLVFNILVILHKK
jgi:hypothetical protein